MAEQLTMDEFFGDQKIGALSEPHLACLLLLDVSFSMYGPALKSLRSAIIRFKKNVMKDPVASKRVDVALVTFSSEVKVINDFCPIGELPSPTLKASGNTETAKGIQVAIDLVKKRTHLYQSFGTPCYKPWIFMITDGQSSSSPEEMAEAARRIHEEEESGSHGRLTFWALGTDSYDSEELFQLTDRVMELKDQDFSGIFDWLSESMSTLSQSHVGERIETDNLPTNARIAQKNRKINEDWQ